MKLNYSVRALLAATAVVALATVLLYRPATHISPDELSLSLHFLDGLTGQPKDEHLPDIRFLHYGCHLSLLLTNNSDETATFWKPDCPPGDMAIRLEFKKDANSKSIGVAQTSQMYTGGMGIPKTFSLPPNESLVYRIDLSSYWSLPFALNDDESKDVFVRAVYESDKWEMSSFMPSNSNDVWEGKLTTKWQKVRLSNVSGKSVGSNSPANSPANLFGTVNQANNV